MSEATLLEALGSPPLEACTHAAATPEWVSRRNSLRFHLRALGCRAAVATPSALWAAAGAPARPGRTWAQLAGLSLAALAARLSLPSCSAPLRLASWNARWLLQQAGCG